MLQKRPKIKIKGEYYENLKQIVFHIAQRYLKKYVTEMSQDTIKKISKKTSQTLYALYAALESCYTHANVLEQFSNSYHFPEKVLIFFEKTFPYLPDLKPFNTEDFDVMTSPMTPNHDEEIFLGKTFGNLVELILGKALPFLKRGQT